MGKLKGLIQFTGALDGMSFYELDGKVIVRKTGGFDGNAIKTKENYIRTRENASEFGGCTIVGKQFRCSLGSYMKKMKNPQIHGYVAGLMTRIMKCDTLSERGKRQVAIGIMSAEGRQLLTGFDFNKHLAFDQMVAARYVFSLEEGRLVFEDVSSATVGFPEAASVLSLKLLLLRFDFGSGAFVLSEGMPVVVSRTDTPAEIVLAAEVPEGAGVLLGLEFVEFLQEVSGEFYGLEGCGLRCFEVGD